MHVCVRVVFVYRRVCEHVCVWILKVCVRPGVCVIEVSVCLVCKLDIVWVCVQG